MANSEVRCGGCNNIIEEASDLPVNKRNPCPACGSTVRALSVNVSSTIHIHESLAFKHKDRLGGVLAEGKSGDEFYRKTGEWRKLERTIDRVKKIYKKTIRDAKTGKVLWSWEEPLDQHLGHGSDKTFKNSLRRKYKKFIHWIFGRYKG